MALRKSDGWLLSSCVPENSGMFSNCMVRLGGVCVLGEGGVGVLVGGGGKSEYEGSANENSEMFLSKGGCSLEGVREDSDVEDDGTDEL